MGKVMLTHAQAKNLAPVWTIACAMAEASNTCIIFDTESFSVYPVSEEFHAVIEEVNANDIEYAKFNGIQLPTVK